MEIKKTLIEILKNSYTMPLTICVAAVFLARPVVYYFFGDDNPEAAAWLFRVNDASMIFLALSVGAINASRIAKKVLIAAIKEYEALLKGETATKFFMANISEDKQSIEREFKERMGGH